MRRRKYGLTYLKLGQNDDPRQLALHIGDAGVGCADAARKDVLVYWSSVGVRTGRSGVDRIVAKRLYGQFISCQSRLGGCYAMATPIGLTGSRRFFSAQSRISSRVSTFNGSHSVKEGVVWNPSAKSWAWSDGYSSVR